MSRRRFVLGLVGGAAALAGGGFGLVVYKDQRWVASPHYTRDGSGPAETAVVVYSRSGNTLVAAKSAARVLDAELYTLEAPAYPRTLAGQMRAADDADAEQRATEITHRPFDASRYARIVLCAPVWWYRPAVPLWAFVGRADLRDRPVFLLMTGNSRYEPAQIDAFGAWVEAHGGRFEGHGFVRRGRVLWQISTDALRREAQRIAAGAFGEAATG